VLTVTTAALQAITISAASSSIAKGTTDQFTATGTFSDGSTQLLTNSAIWTSSNTAAATVSSTGLATGTGIGSTNITAVKSGVTSNTFVLTVTAAALQSITVTAPSSSLIMGLTEQLTATGTFTDSSTQDLSNSVIWTSSNATVATISGTGLLTAVSIGSSNISATKSGVISNIFAFAVIAPTHSVDLTWTASTSVVVGYNVYRGTQSGGPYTLVNSILVATTAYTDATVQNGATYFYVITAVDASSNESAYSAQAGAVIPIQ